MRAKDIAGIMNPNHNVWVYKFDKKMGYYCLCCITAYELKIWNRNQLFSKEDEVDFIEPDGKALIKIYLKS